MSAVTTHVLDLTSGNPAADIEVQLYFAAEDGWEEIGDGTTDTDGRVSDLLPEHHDLAEGDYRLVFETGDYFDGRDVDTFYPRIEVTFRVGAAREHFHVPLLLSPYGYSTYRGS